MGAATSVVETPHDPVALFREIFAALNRKNADDLLQYWTEDVAEEFPNATCRSRAEVRDYFASLFAAIPDFHIEPKKIIAEGDTVFVRWHATGTFTGAPWMGIRPSGSKLEVYGIDCFTLRHGKISAAFVVFDQMSFARQIGIMPPEGSAMDCLLINAFNTKTRLRKRLRR
jgi:steroid delta-isomerase-like uncharacterized protein